MKKHITLHKEIGETPLAALSKFKENHTEYMNIPASYAGRLDPMAEGKLLVLFGEECKKQKEYTGLDKEYEIEVLLDIETDTGDVLGMPLYKAKETKPSKEEILKALLSQKGTHIRKYPRFSSTTVNGTPLFLHTLLGNNVEIPEHEEHIYSIRLKRSTIISSTSLMKRVLGTLTKVPRTTETSKALGEDFRQDAIREAWQTLFTSLPDREFIVLKLSVVCGSGTYMRTLAGEIGKSLGTSGLALSIKRTKIGKYWKGFWTTSY